MKENTLFQLDLLEAFYLQKTPRFGVTKQIINSEKYPSKTKSKKSNVKKHKLLTISRNEAFELIKQFKTESFNKKLYNLEHNILRDTNKFLKNEKSKNKDIVDRLLNDDNLLKENIKHKIFKMILTRFKENLSIKDEKFDGLSTELIEYVKNMKNSNPYKTNGNDINNFFSRIWSDKLVKNELENIDGFEIIWGPKSRTSARSDKEDVNVEQKRELEEPEFSDADNFGDSEDDDVASKIAEIDDDENFEEIYDGYKNYIADSSENEDEDEENVEGGFQPDPKINYNEITDDEPSEDESEVENTNENGKRVQSIEEDDFFSTDGAQDTKRKKLDIQLPHLATGYYSGGESDEESTKDRLVDEITQPRKNRRGQRARQKIWEKKYGKTAKHVIKAQERNKSERERLKEEYEERKARRDAKEKVREEREQERKQKEAKEKEKKEFVHPSWAAKLKAQEMQKVKFAGKKVTFD